MENDKTKNMKGGVSVLSAGLALGLVFGGLFGLFVDNLVLFAGGGMILGLAMGTAIVNKRIQV